MTDLNTWLEHHGVKGMKWGVRKRTEAREKSPLTTTQVAEKKRRDDKIKKILLVSAGVSVATVAGVLATKQIRSEFASVNLEPDTVLQNVNPFGDALDLNKRTFATFKPGDNKIYADKFAKEVAERVGTKEVFKTSLRAKEHIRAPSKSQTKKLFREWSKETGAFSGKKVDDALKNYGRGLMLDTSPNSPTSFVSYLEKHGYNAMQDYLDQSNGYKAKVPLMIFDGAKVLDKVVSEKI